MWKDLQRARKKNSDGLTIAQVHRPPGVVTPQTVDELHILLTI